MLALAWKQAVNGRHSLSTAGGRASAFSLDVALRSLCTPARSEQSTPVARQVVVGSLDLASVHKNRLHIFLKQSASSCLVPAKQARQVFTNLRTMGDPVMTKDAACRWLDIPSSEPMVLVSCFESLASAKLGSEARELFDRLRETPDKITEAVMVAYLKTVFSDKKSATEGYRIYREFAVGPRAPLRRSLVVANTAIRVAARAFSGDLKMQVGELMVIQRTIESVHGSLDIGSRQNLMRMALTLGAFETLDKLRAEFLALGGKVGDSMELDRTVLASFCQRDVEKAYAYYREMLMATDSLDEAAHLEALDACRIGKNWTLGVQILESVRFEGHNITTCARLLQFTKELLEVVPKEPLPVIVDTETSLPKSATQLQMEREMVLSRARAAQDRMVKVMLDNLLHEKMLAHPSLLVTYANELAVHGRVQFALHYVQRNALRFEKFSSSTFVLSFLRALARVDRWRECLMVWEVSRTFSSFVKQMDAARMLGLLVETLLSNGQRERAKWVATDSMAGVLKTPQLVYHCVQGARTEMREDVQAFLVAIGAPAPQAPSKTPWKET